ncbi:MAG: fluoride efflux transporter CrcB [Nocardioides sp.]|nr:fluoride efflux transporter CrcB [Nocardioides sp.]
MNVLDLLLVAVGAAVGAPVRYVVGSLLDGRGWPLGTFAVNVVGSLLLGVFSALALGGHPAALLGTGLCGGLTTYSSFAVQTVRLGQGAAGYAVATIGASLAAAYVGFVLVA